MSEWELVFPAGRVRRCRVRSGAGALARLIDDLRAEPPGSPLYVVSDSNVAPLHGEPFLDRVRARGLRADLLVFEAGEANKTRETKSMLEDRLLQSGAGRDCALVALGGGVTGDLAGFVAATWNRGVPVVQVPTTLLSMADAALGGKTAVNVCGVKNQIGAFVQPWGVYADTSTLTTLDESVYREGLAEIVKTAVIADAALFARLERESEAILRRDPEAVGAVVEACLRIKGRIVEADERESGPRAALNFGHTVGHALESLALGGLSHGRAVSIGMSVEAALAVARTGFPAEDVTRLRALLRSFGLPTGLPGKIHRERLLEATRSDKKRHAGRMRYALPRAIGAIAGDGLPVAVEDAEVLRALDV